MCCNNKQIFVADQLIIPGTIMGPLQGFADGGTLDVTTTPKRLPDNPCKLVKLELWDTQEDSGFSALASEEIIYWGYNQGVYHRLASGGNTELLPLNNTNQIIVRSQSGTVTLFYSWYW
jgi:hypothetical protein